MPPVNNVWANNATQAEPEEMTLPSGQVCMARKIGIEGLIEAGILNEADSLTALVVADPVEKGKGRLQGHKAKAPTEAQQEAELMQRMMKDPKALPALLTLADKAIPLIVVQPPVHLHHTNTGDKSQRVLTATERDKLRKDNPGLVFTDQIDLLDKMELFSWAVGDLGSLPAFRETAQGAVDRMAVEPGVSRPTKRAARNS